MSCARQSWSCGRWPFHMVANRVAEATTRHVLTREAGVSGEARHFTSPCRSGTHIRAETLAHQHIAMPSTVPRTPLPLRPILSVLVVLFANSMVMTLPFSFLPFLVRDFGYRYARRFGRVCRCAVLGVPASQLIPPPPRPAPLPWAFVHEHRREEDVGYYSGFIASAMFFGRFVTSYAWGRLTDSMGRKAVIVYSTAGVAGM